MLKYEKVLVFGMLLFMAGIVMFAIVAANTIKEHQTKDDNIYMICDVYDIAVNGEQVLVDIELPNGELLTKQLSVNDDLPEEFEEVVIKTSDLDDYTTYKIVGMR